jgi:hypothetical protein
LIRFQIGFRVDVVITRSIAILISASSVVIAQRSDKIGLVGDAGVETPVWVSTRTGFLNGGPALEIDTRFVATLGVVMNSESSSRGVVGSYVGSAASPGYRVEFRYRRRQQDGAGWHASAGTARSAFRAHSGVPGRWVVTGITGGVGLERGWLDVDARVDLLGADRTHGDYQALVQIVTIGAHLARR